MNIVLEDESDEEFDLTEDGLQPLPSIEEREAEAEAEDLVELDQERDLLIQLQLLHQKLAKVRAKHTRQNDDQTEPESTEHDEGKCPRFLSDSNKLIICAIRKPVKMSKSKKGDAWAYRVSQSALKSSIDYIAKSNPVTWVGWPGAYVEEGTRSAVRHRLETEYSYSPIFMGKDTQDSIEAFCGDVLFPNLHGIPSDFNYEATTQGIVSVQYDAFCYMNMQYAERVAEIYEPGDIVLVHNYHLMLLPQFIRKRLSKCVIGFFLHSPFPSSEIFQELPKRNELLKGILGSDVIAFNHFDYVRHFQNACARTLGLEAYPTFEFGQHGSFSYENRRIALEICPAGIDPQKFASALPLSYFSPIESSSSNSSSNISLALPNTEEKGHQKDEIGSVASLVNMMNLKYRQNGGKLVLSIDRLDWCRGLPQKLQALENLFTDFPHWRGKVTFFVIVRDHPGNQTTGHLLHLRQTVNRLVGKVNGKFGFADYVPIHFIHRTLLQNEITALYTVADALLVTSIREGINLTALEFVACQSMHYCDTKPPPSSSLSSSSLNGEPGNNENMPHSRQKFDIHEIDIMSEKGVLIYSEFAGCVSSFKGGLVVNPYDDSAVAKTINEALTMRPQSKNVRMHQLARYMSEYTSSTWSFRMMTILAEYTSLHKGNSGFNDSIRGLSIKLDISYLRSFYERSGYRLLVLDYDGALMPVQPLSQLNAPSESLLTVLKALCEDPCNCVIITTRNEKEVVEEWFQSLPNLGLIADHGYWIRPPIPPKASLSGVSLLNDQDGLGEVVDLDCTLESRPLASSSSVLPSQHTQEESLFIQNSTLDNNSTIKELEKKEEFNQENNQTGAKDSDNRWIQLDYIHRIDLSWMEEVLPIMEDFTKRTPGSLLEKSACCLRWNFRDSDADFGPSQAKNLQLHFNQMLRKFPVRVTTAGAHKCVVLQPLRVSKGRALQYLLTQVLPNQQRNVSSPIDDKVEEVNVSDVGDDGGNGGRKVLPIFEDDKKDDSVIQSSQPTQVSESVFDHDPASTTKRYEVVLSISDDRTDEDIPLVWRGQHPILLELAAGLFAVNTGGTKLSKAKFCVEDVSEVLWILKALTEVSAKLGNEPHWLG